jgi:hypothetical protein
MCFRRLKGTLQLYTLAFLTLLFANGALDEFRLHSIVEKHQGLVLRRVSNLNTTGPRLEIWSLKTTPSTEELEFITRLPEIKSIDLTQVKQIKDISNYKRIESLAKTHVELLLSRKRITTDGGLSLGFLLESWSDDMTIEQNSFIDLHEVYLPASNDQEVLGVLRKTCCLSGIELRITPYGFQLDDCIK